MRFAVLGPIEVTTEDGPVDLAGPLPRRLLAALVAADGQPVSDEALIEVIWDGEPPARALASVQSYVSVLRKAIGGREVLARSVAGYHLVIAAGGTDVAHFAAAVARGREQLARDEFVDALEAFDEALALWRGEPYAELADATRVRSERAALAELRKVAVEERLAARLGTGDAAGAAAELEGAVADEPFRERRWVLLTLALYRSGRQADALAALRRVRELLVDELGVDPGAELRELEGAVLAQDPALLHAPAPAMASVPVAAESALPVAVSRSTLPRPLSSFVGRVREIGEIGRLLGEHRLVSLVGPAGAGKTRLAVEHAVAGPHTSDVWFVRLADVQDPAVVPVAVAEGLGVAGASADPVAAVVRALEGRGGLLVLDNCEHLIEASATVAERLLSAVPGLSVLATSREPLGVDGEIVLNVAPLAVSEASGADGPALTLLTDRIRQVRPGWSPDAAEKTAMRSIASALDGIPLALELAAARSRVLSLTELASSLDDVFAVLPKVPRSAMTPHATLDAAIAWSIDLLGDDERALVLRLWPFEGGFSLSAAEAVSGSTATLTALSSLVTRSVVRADTSVSPTRYGMFETIRAYCRRESPDAGADLAAQARWVRELSVEVAEGMHGPRAGRWMRQIEREMPNVRAAMAYLLANDADGALAVVGNLGWFFYRRGHVAEGRRWAAEALAAGPDASPRLRGLALAAWARLDYLDGLLDGERRPIDRALELLEDEDADRAAALCHSAYFLMRTGDLDGACARARLAREAALAVDARWVVAEADMVLGAAVSSLGDAAEGQRLLAQSVEEAMACEHRWAAASSWWLSSLIDLAGGAPEMALDSLRRGLALLDQEEDISSTLVFLLAGAGILAALGRSEDAASVMAAFDLQAARAGYSPREMDPSTTAAVEALVAEVTTHEQRAAAAERASTAGWDDALDLLGVSYVRPRA